VATTLGRPAATPPAPEPARDDGHVGGGKRRSRVGRTRPFRWIAGGVRRRAVCC